MSSNSTINELFTDNEPIDMESIIQLLKQYVRVKRDTNEVFFTEDGNKASVLRKILIFALTHKLLKVEGFIETESISARLVSEKLQIKKGSIDSSFNRLRGKGFIIGSGADYVIPHYKIGEIITLLKEEKDEQS